MGLSASQSRMLALFGRRSDTEHQVQQTNNKRTVLANLTAEASRQYAEKSGNRAYKYQVNPGTNSSYYKDYDGTDLSNKYPATTDASGNVISDDYTFSWTDATGQVVNYSRSEIKELSPSVVYDLLSSQNFVVSKAGVQEPTIDTTTWDEGLYTADDQAAAAIYQTKTSEYQAQDKMLENEIKNLDTQHQAIQTEIDAVKKVIDKDIEMTFKTFA